MPTRSAFGVDPVGYLDGLHRALWVACAVAALGEVVAGAFFRGRRP